MWTRQPQGQDDENEEIYVVRSLTRFPAKTPLNTDAAQFILIATI